MADRPSTNSQRSVLSLFGVSPQTANGLTEAEAKDMIKSLRTKALEVKKKGEVPTLPDFVTELGLSVNADGSIQKVPSRTDIPESSISITEAHDRADGPKTNRIKAFFERLFGDDLKPKEEEAVELLAGDGTVTDVPGFEQPAFIQRPSPTMEAEPQIDVWGGDVPSDVTSWGGPVPAEPSGEFVPDVPAFSPSGGAPRGFVAPMVPGDGTVEGVPGFEPPSAPPPNPMPTAAAAPAGRVDPVAMEGNIPMPGQKPQPPMIPAPGPKPEFQGSGIPVPGAKPTDQQIPVPGRKPEFQGSGIPVPGTKPEAPPGPVQPDPEGINTMLTSMRQYGVDGFTFRGHTFVRNDEMPSGYGLVEPQERPGPLAPKPGETYGGPYRDENSG